jgi:hypothetical protein
MVSSHQRKAVLVGKERYESLIEQSRISDKRILALAHRNGSIIPSTASPFLLLIGSAILPP